MKYVLLMGRGLEGAGNTKYAVELQAYIESTGNECVTYANKDKHWGREKSHDNHVEIISYAKNAEELKAACKSADRVIVLSVPAKNFTAETKDAFLDIVKETYEAGVPTTYIQVDHKIHSINRNFYAEDAYGVFFRYISRVITHSKDGDFVRFCKKHELTLNNLVTASDKLNGINGLDFDKYKRFWKTFEEKEYRTIKFLGRVAEWKGPWLFREMHEKCFREKGFISTLEGIEMSIQSLQFLYTSWDPVKIVREDNTLWTTADMGTKLDNGELTFERYHNVYCLPPYNNEKAMDRMSRQQFGVELLLLDDRFLPDIMEYAMMEIVAVGTVPIYRKRWGELFKINGKPLIDFGEECGMVFLDENNPEEAVNLVCELSDNKEKYLKYRENAFNFCKKYLDTKVIFNQLLDIINKDEQTPSDVVFYKEVSLF